ncbi:MAG: protein-disulfide reductase DsbD domain-containing protein [Planctomycetota bacterium]|jgi:thiol:disulfide interchange protein DsbD
MKNHRTFQTVLALGLCLALASTAPASEPEFSPLATKLVSDATAIVPGQTITVGIHQSMLPGYHTYWKNAGTLGLPTAMHWDLPEGFTAGPIQWDIPIVTKMATYNIWGYEDTALLLIDIQTPADLEPGTEVTLAGTAVWMCCGAACYPGNGRLEITLPVKSQATTPTLDPRWDDAFDQVRRNQPIASDKWNVACTKEGDEYTLTVRPQDKSLATDKAPLFFGYLRQVSSDKGQTVKRLTNGGFIITMQQEEHTPETEATRLTGVLVSDRPWDGPSGRNSSRVLAIDVAIK